MTKKTHNVNTQTIATPYQWCWRLILALGIIKQRGSIVHARGTALLQFVGKAWCQNLTLSLTGSEVNTICRHAHKRRKLLFGRCWRKAGSRSRSDVIMCATDQDCKRLELDCYHHAQALAPTAAIKAILPHASDQPTAHFPHKERIECVTTRTKGRADIRRWAKGAKMSQGVHVHVAPASSPVVDIVGADCRDGMTMLSKQAFSVPHLYTSYRAIPAVSHCATSNHRPPRYLDCCTRRSSVSDSRSLRRREGEDEHAPRIAIEPPRHRPHTSSASHLPLRRACSTAYPLAVHCPEPPNRARPTADTAPLYDYRWVARYAGLEVFNSGAISLCAPIGAEVVSSGSIWPPANIIAESPAITDQLKLSQTS
ncbi:hypothetical protein OPT61_g2869 [Boeremia exigua]|uniref:Uncharacterized protein n=1 Tax=Boeremia exigua TaxID=749465 RepID=A0ACC2IJW7_9PLEO|nr:hypothetical protein OPT61_g2869 [Boeremia exigua]